MAALDHTRVRIRLRRVRLRRDRRRTFEHASVTANSMSATQPGSTPSIDNASRLIWRTTGTLASSLGRQSVKDIGIYSTGSLLGADEPLTGRQG